MRKAFFILFIFISFQSISQLSIEPTITPTFFAADEEITITYNVTGTAMHDWTEAWLWLWLPDQNVDVASNVNPASSNSTASNPARFTKSEVDGKQLFEIVLTLTEFTGTAKEDIKQVGMLIKGNDWSDGQSNDYVTEISEGFTLLLESPTQNYNLFNTAQTLAIVAKTSEMATIDLYLDDVLIVTVTNSTLLEATHNVVIDGQVHVLKIAATNGTDILEKTYSYTSTPTTVNAVMPSNLKKGVNYNENNTSVTLVLEAPGKEYVFVLGDFNSWLLNNDYLMFQDGEFFWVTINNLTPTQPYVFQYLIDGELLIADPYTDQVSDPWDDKHIDATTYPSLIEYPEGKTEYRASVLETGQQPYTWVNTDFVMPVKENLVIYELLVRDFDEKHTYQAIIDKLDYLQGLGINALELMPTNEFEGNQSWGYNPNFYFAPDKYYGHKNELKKLIDECHARGIAVIIDLVLNHSFNSSPLARMYWNDLTGKPAADNPWYNENHNFENTAAHWGADFNHESSYTQNFVDSVNLYWMQEYNVDGFRFDFTKGFGNRFKSNSSDSWGSLYDGDRVRLLKRMADKIWKKNPNTYVIFEHLAENKEEQELANYGVMLWGNKNHDYRTVAKGNAASLSSVYHTYRGWDDTNLIGYMESHDEERVAWDVLKTFDLTQSLQRLKLNAAFFFTVPGPKMVWQFGELGYDEELNNDRLGIKPTHWEYLDDTERKDLFDVYSSLINLKTKTQYIDDQYFKWSASASQKWLTIEHPTVNIAIVGNFGKAPVAMNTHFTKNGIWYNYFSGEEVEVTDFENHEIVLSEGDFRIYTSEVIDNYIDGNPAKFIAGFDNAGNTSRVKIYPNPAKHSVMINSTDNWMYAEIIDVRGVKIINTSLKKKQLDVSQLEAGLYILRLTNHLDEVTQLRFIKE